MRTKGRLKSMNIEDKRPSKIVSSYQGYSLSNGFMKQMSKKPKSIKKRGRSVSVGVLSRKVYVSKSGGYR